MKNKKLADRANLALRWDNSQVTFPFVDGGVCSSAFRLRFLEL